MGESNSVNTDPNSAGSGVPGPLELELAALGLGDPCSPTSATGEAANRAAAGDTSTPADPDPGAELDAPADPDPAPKAKRARGRGKAETADGPGPDVETAAGA